MKSAMNLQRLQKTNIEGEVKLDAVFDLIRNAKNVIVFFRNEIKQEFRLLYSDFGEEEFLMMSILLLRNIEVFNFFKLVIIDIEKNRAIPCEEQDFSYRALEYIKLNKLSNMDLNI